MTTPITNAAFAQSLAVYQAQFNAGELMLAFPTRVQLEQLSAFQSTDALIDHARGREIEPLMPHVVGTGQQARVVLPADLGR